MVRLIQGGKKQTNEKSVNISTKLYQYGFLIQILSDFKSMKHYLLQLLHLGKIDLTFPRSTYNFCYNKGELISQIGGV